MRGEVGGNVHFGKGSWTAPQREARPGLPRAAADCAGKLAVPDAAWQATGGGASPALPAGGQAASSVRSCRKTPGVGH